MNEPRQPREIVVAVDDIEFGVEIKPNYIRYYFKEGVGEEAQRHYSPMYGYMGKPEITIKRGSPLNEEIEHA